LAYEKSLKCTGHGNLKRSQKTDATTAQAATTAIKKYFIFDALLRFI
jgi:hypothetical protein